MEGSSMIKLVIGKTYIHNENQEKVVITNIKTGSAQGKPTTVFIGDESLTAHEFKKTYKHANTGAPRW